MTDNAVITGLREQFAQYCDPDNPHPDVTAICQIGAFSIPSRDDISFLKFALSELHLQGVSISPNFEWRAVNLTEGRDYLAETEPAQCVVSGFVNKESGRHLASPHQNDPRKWDEASNRLGAKFIAVVSAGDTEIQAQDFIPDDGSGHYAGFGRPLGGVVLLKHKNFRF